MHDRTARASGIALGKRAAGAILALRADDGSRHAEPRLGVDCFPGDEPGQSRQDLISQPPIARVRAGELCDLIVYYTYALDALAGTLLVPTSRRSFAASRRS